MLHLHPRNRLCWNRRSLAAPIVVFIAASSFPPLLPVRTILPTSDLGPPTIFAEATDVKWEGNRDVKPEHEAAHNAPRSQKYWDEHGIERPEYAKTDAEVAAERKQEGGGGGGIMGLMGFILVIFGIFAMALCTYAGVTGDWDAITNNPVASFGANCINLFLEKMGIRGHKLGTSSAVGAGAGDEDERRSARLARFDNPTSQTNMLDNMKDE